MRDKKLKLEDQNPLTHKGEWGKGIPKERVLEVCEWEG
jgi:hypothetical protein